MRRTSQGQATRQLFLQRTLSLINFWLTDVENQNASITGCQKVAHLMLPGLPVLKKILRIMIMPFFLKSIFLLRYFIPVRTERFFNSSIKLRLALRRLRSKMVLLSRKPTREVHVKTPFVMNIPSARRFQKMGNADIRSMPDLQCPDSVYMWPSSLKHAVGPGAGLQMIHTQVKTKRKVFVAWC